MTPQEIEAFLQRPLVAHLATLHPDGRPHVTPVWYLYEDGRLHVLTAEGSVKLRNLRRDPRVALCVATDEPPYAYVTLRGWATVVEGDDTWGLLQRLAIRYRGPVEGPRYARQVRDTAFVHIAITPVRAFGWRE